MLDVQQAAAAALPGVGRRREAAIGARPGHPRRHAGDDGKNLIWGWLRLATTADGAKRRAAENAASDPAAAENAERFDDLFFEARYNVAKARFRAQVRPAGAPSGSNFDVGEEKYRVDADALPRPRRPQVEGRVRGLLKRIDQELEKLTMRIRKFAAMASLVAVGLAWAAWRGPRAASTASTGTNGVDSGQITGVTALGVTISKGGVESTIAAEDIESVYFAGEPPS